MSEQAKSGRDAFTFSLAGVAAVNWYAFVPVVADDRINRARARRLSQDLEDQPDTILEIENFLARYLAPGYRDAA